MQSNRMRTARSLPYGGGVSVPDRDSVDGNPLTETPPESPGQRPPWTETPIQGGLWGSLSGGLCLGVSVWGSLSRVTLSNGSLCPMGSLSNGVSVQGISVTMGVSWTEISPGSETPIGQRPPLDRDATLDRDPPETETPIGQRPPLDRDALDRDPHVQRPPGHVTCGACWDRDPPDLWCMLGQRSPPCERNNRHV